MRNRRNEPLSWRVVTQSERGNSGVTELVRREVEVEKSPKLAQGSRAVEEVDQCTEQRLQISLQGQQGLGCSICKVRAVQQFQQLATSCGHGELRNAQTMGGGGGSCLRAANSNTNSAKSARVTQPCCQVVLDLSRPPLPTHQCHVSSAWHTVPLAQSPPQNPLPPNYWARLCGTRAGGRGLHLNAALSYPWRKLTRYIHLWTVPAEPADRIGHTHHLTRITLICH